MVKNRFKSIVIQLKKKYPEVKDEEDLLRMFIIQQPNEIMEEKVKGERPCIRE